MKKIRITIEKLLYVLFNRSSVFNSPSCSFFYNVPRDLTKNRIQRLITILKPYVNVSNCSFVEHACHDGHYISEIKRLLPKAHCTGTDISETILKANRQNSLNVGIYFEKLDLRACFNMHTHTVAAFSDYDVIIVSDVLYYLAEWNMPCFFYWTPIIQLLLTRKRAAKILKNWIQQTDIIIVSDHQYHKTVYPILMKLVSSTCNERLWLIDDFWIISIKRTSLDAIITSQNPC